MRHLQGFLQGWLSSHEVGGEVGGWGSGAFQTAGEAQEKPLLFQLSIQSLTQLQRTTAFYPFGEIMQSMSSCMTDELVTN